MAERIKALGRGGEDLAFSNWCSDDREVLGRSERYGVIDGFPIHAEKIDVVSVFSDSVVTKYGLQYWVI